MMAAAISTKKKTHSIAHPHTKVWMRVEVASGLTSPMVNQMPTPVMAPKTSVSSSKEFGVTAAVVEHGRVLLPPRKSFGHHQEKAAADRKLRDEDVQHCDQRDQHAAWNRKLPVWIVQRAHS